MSKYKVIVEYDGGKYKGWQRLGDNDKTIQGKIEAILSKLLNGNIEIHGSGRTDAGVHAYGQVAHFETNQEIDTEDILTICNEMLPQDIVIKEFEKVFEDFHARFSAKGKSYVYKIWNTKIPSAIMRKYTYHVPETLNIEAMKLAAFYFIGEHNFQSFTMTKSKKKSMTRIIHGIEIMQKEHLIEFYFYGQGFLYKMVRIMMGTLIEVGLGKREPEDIKEILLRMDRKYAGGAAPSHGLYLLKVDY